MTAFELAEALLTSEGAGFACAPAVTPARRRCTSETWIASRTASATGACPGAASGGCSGAPPPALFLLGEALSWEPDLRPSTRIGEALPGLRLADPDNGTQIAGCLVEMAECLLDLQATRLEGPGGRGARGSYRRRQDPTQELVEIPAGGLACSPLMSAANDCERGAALRRQSLLWRRVSAYLSRSELLDWRGAARYGLGDPGRVRRPQARHGGGPLARGLGPRQAYHCPELRADRRWNYRGLPQRGPFLKAAELGGAVRDAVSPLSFGSNAALCLEDLGEWDGAWR